MGAFSDPALILPGAVGTTQLASGAVTDAKVNAAAAIAGSKISATFTGLIFPQQQAAHSKTMVGTSPTGGDDAAGYIRFVPFTAGVSANIDGLVVRLTQSVNARAALYSDSSNSPNTLLVSSNSTAITLNTDTVLAVTPTAITNGTKYWLAVQGSAACNCPNCSSSEGSVVTGYMANTYGNGMPATATMTPYASSTTIYYQGYQVFTGPAYVKGGIYFDTVTNKLMVGGATAWETVTSS
jgi:hypothetical protein